MQLKYKTQYNNPYSARDNVVIFLYKTFRPKSFKLYLNKVIAYGISLILRRVFFGLMKREKNYQAVGTIGNINFNFRSLNSQFHSIYFKEYHDCYEPEVFAVLDLLLPDGGCLIDVGSNWGHHTFMWIVQRNAKVIAFEPNNYVFRDMLSIAEQLEVADRLIGINAAAGAETSQIEFVQSRFESGLGSVDESFINLVNDKYKKFPEKFLDVITFNKSFKQVALVKKIDDCLMEQRQRIDVIKLDCEGGELSALEGAIETLKNDKPHLIFEIHTHQMDFQPFATLLEPLGYNFYHIKTDVPGRTFTLEEVKSVEKCTSLNILASHEKLGLASGTIA